METIKAIVEFWGMLVKFIQTIVCLIEPILELILKLVEIVLKAIVELIYFILLGSIKLFTIVWYKIFPYGLWKKRKISP